MSSNDTTLSPADARFASRCAADRAGHLASALVAALHLLALHPACAEELLEVVRWLREARGLGLPDPTWALREDCRSTRQAFVYLNAQLARAAACGWSHETDRALEAIEVAHERVRRVSWRAA